MKTRRRALYLISAILVLSLWQPHGLERAVKGEGIGTRIAG